jgi:hypothetical protein
MCSAQVDGGAGVEEAGQKVRRRARQTDELHFLTYSIQ